MPGSLAGKTDGAVSGYFFESLRSLTMANEEQKQEGKGFTVKDRRRFASDTGEVREETATSDAAPESSGTTPSAEAPPAERPAQEPLPEINFSTFIISLSTQALMHLGEMANPITGNAEPDVPVAKQMIDIIGMLREKTRGNLSASDDRLMEDILFDLRRKYVEAVKKK
jgi:hypothetical protein